VSGKLPQRVGLVDAVALVPPILISSGSLDALIIDDIQCAQPQDIDFVGTGFLARGAQLADELVKLVLHLTGMDSIVPDWTRQRAGDPNPAPRASIEKVLKLRQHLKSSSVFDWAILDVN
jgi:hypothetical protein